MATLNTVISSGTRASQPAATSVPAGSLYYVTDENKIERSDASAWAAYSYGGVVQVKSAETGAVATGTTTIPFDDTIPQNTEGTEFLTLAITPKSTAHKLRIDVTVFVTSTGTPWLIAALFQDTTANAIATAATFNNLSTAGATIHFTHHMTAGTVSATTFKLHVGPSSAATVTVNGQSGGRIFGGVAVTSITITEYMP